jgi:aminoglycoside phosphotransferase
MWSHQNEPDAERRADVREMLAERDELRTSLRELHDSYVKACPMANQVAQRARAVLGELAPNGTAKL